MAKSRANPAPIEHPTIEAAVAPTASNTAARSSRLENGSVPIGVSPNPRASGVVHRKRSRKAATCGFHMVRSAIPACRKTRSGPSPTVS